MDRRDESWWLLLAMAGVLLVCLLVSTLTTMRAQPFALPADSPGAGYKINVNTADAATLDQLPGIGEKTAQAIIDARPYDSIEDVLDAKGVGEITLAKIEPFITVS